MRHSIFVLAAIFLASCQPTPKQETPVTVPGTSTTTTSTTSTTTQDHQDNGIPVAPAPKQDNSPSKTDTVKVKGTTTHQEIRTYPTRKNDLSDTAAEIRKTP